MTATSIRVGFALNPGDPFWVQVREAAFQRAQELGVVLVPEPIDLPPLYLRGLDPAARYTVEGFPGIRSGQAWMNTGLRLPLQDLQSTIRRIHRIDQEVS